ncbi:chromosome segregation protein SMC [Prosthecochloris sp. CIB 2401]|uniref:chromosome segregation protein SMC n=1 Tax=Prosthecochloris sp. CIB 2401 TaxID=1868325 RepID=UPI00080AA07D|nr:chromosome segregation protein SMC [Prosthecochloris sp. CIB 2401]ANT64268.1 Chromosome partition protein Smc [Prosthecochloris sp. CIB 2401]
MYLSKIELFGFKSFAHRVKITFDKGLTAIVGPNGCGKTNVVDAIRWVLGEQKSALLRSTKMENIIFNGTRKLKPQSLSEVSLTIENTRNVLPVEYTEVTVTRRLYRSGESEYLLNQVPCRLKDILDLFADTGMGSDAYSVIELKMIEEIISNKSEERMKLLEEAAGITRYKQRRKQTFRQLDITSRDLNRVDDLISEVSKKVRSLHSQVQKAEKYRSIRKELKEIDLNLCFASLQEKEARLHPVKEKAFRQERQNRELATSISTEDSRLQEEERKQLDMEQQLSMARQHLATHAEQSHQNEKKLLQLNQEIRSLREKMNRLEASRAAKEKQIQELDTSADTLEKQLAPIARQATRMETGIAKLQAEKTALDQGLAEARRHIEEQRAEQSQLERLRTELQITRQQHETSRELIRKRLERFTREEEQLREHIARSEPERTSLLGKTDTARKRIAQLHNELERLKQLREQAARQQNASREQLLELRSEQNQLHNNLLLVSSILENYDGLPEGIAYLQGNSSPRGLGCLSDLISLAPEYRKAVNAALGDALGYYICRTTEEARQGINRITTAQKGKVSFMVLERLTRKPAPGNEISEAIALSSLVEAPPEIQPALELLLESCYLAPDLTAAEQLSMRHPTATFVTAKGEKTDPRGILHGGSSKENEGLRLGRKAEQEQLQAAHRSVTQRIKTEEERLLQLQREVQQLPIIQSERDLEQANRELQQLEKQITEFDVRLESRKNELQRQESEIETAKKELQSTTTGIEALTPRIRETSRQLEAASEQLALLQKNAAEEEKRHATLLQELQSQHSRYRDIQLELDKIRFRIQSAETSRETLLQNMASLKAEATQSKQLLAESTRKEQALDSETRELQARTAKLDQEMTSRETAYSELKIANQQLRDKLREMRREHQVGVELAGELQRTCSELQRGIDALLTSAETRYDCNLRALDLTLPEGFGIDSSTKKVEELRLRLERFGAVNELALEEYTGEKERLDFLTTQKEDLIQAETQLRNTIEEINKTALKKFNETFATVRHNFIRIFRELFEETDEADLVITADEDDPLEAHVSIIARPRGKKPLSIEQLSGGEKALTALSLLFSIYLVKPSPFCILDEVDAPLDDANIERFIKLLKKFENNTQFIIVTHNKNTMASSQALYGVTMEEEGVSKLIQVKLEKPGKGSVPGHDG